MGPKGLNAMTADTAIVGHLPFLDRDSSGLLVLGDAGRTIAEPKAGGNGVP